MDEIYTFERLSEGGYIRRDPYDDVPTHVLNKSDLSPNVPSASYTAKCSWCWLGYSHSTAAHTDSVEVCRARACGRPPHLKTDHNQEVAK